MTSHPPPTQPPPRPRRFLNCRKCGTQGEVAPLVEKWVCPSCRLLEQPRDVLGRGR